MRNVFLAWFGPLNSCGTIPECHKYLSIISDQVHLFIFQWKGYFQQDNASFHGTCFLITHTGANIIWTRRNKIGSVFGSFIHYHWIRQYYPSAMCPIPHFTFQHLMESMPRIIATVLKEKGRATFIDGLVITWPVSVVYAVGRQLSF